MQHCFVPLQCCKASVMVFLVSLQGCNVSKKLNKTTLQPCFDSFQPCLESKQTNTRAKQCCKTIKQVCKTSDQTSKTRPQPSTHALQISTAFCLTDKLKQQINTFSNQVGETIRKTTTHIFRATPTHDPIQFKCIRLSLRHQGNKSRQSQPD